jgi:nucleotide-binding universal stress UspA family protein
MNWFAKAIWAMDAFSDEPESDARVLQMARTLFGSRVEIEPVFVLRPGQLEPSREEFFSLATDEALDGVDTLARFFALKERDDLAEPRVLTARGAGLRDASRILAEYAARSHADVILVGTHGRKGLARLAQGSFSELLLHDAATPVCVHPHDVATTLIPKRILYPTDLSEESFRVFRIALTQLASLGLPLTLLHQAIPRVPAPVMAPHPFLLPTPSADLYLENDQLLRDTATEWIDLARSHGVAAECRFNSEADSVAEWILRKSQDCGNGLVVMESHRGRIASALFGSNTRYVMRDATCPVLVYPQKILQAHEPAWRSAG